MIRLMLRCLLVVPLLLVASSSKLYLEMAPVRDVAIKIDAVQIDDADITTEPPLTFVRAWTLSSDDPNFGGVSAMLRDASGFTAVTDAGAIIRFQMDARGRVSNARTTALPKGCAPDLLKPSLDAESVTRDPANGEVLFGFEWRHAICRADQGLKRAIRIVQPAAMRGWSLNSGAEAMVALSDGSTIIFAERGRDDNSAGPALIFDGDPAISSTQVSRFTYRPPAGFHPTDAAQLPDGRLIILNRRYQFPLSFSAVLTVLAEKSIRAGATVEGEVIARIEPPGIADNFEAMVVSRSNGRSFLWLMSDDNFIAYQQTYLLLFEVMR
jgi:hypothetical protein